MVENLDGQIALTVRTFFKRPVGPCCGWGQAAIPHGLIGRIRKRQLPLSLSSHTAATFFHCSVSKWKSHHSVGATVRHSSSSNSSETYLFSVQKSFRISGRETCARRHVARRDATRLSETTIPAHKSPRLRCSISQRHRLPLKLSQIDISPREPSRISRQVHPLSQLSLLFPAAHQSEG